MNRKTVINSVILTASILSTAACASSPSADPQPTAKVSIDSAGAKWAPGPDREFRNITCKEEPAQNPEYPHEPGIRIGEINAETPLQESAELIFPEAPSGIWWSQQSQFGAHDKGATITAGHIDYAPGDLSKEGGELSPFWGHLHEEVVDSCTHVFVTDFDGKHHEYVITGKYLVDQDQLANTTTALTHNGFSLITCAGKTIDAAGGNNQFNYEKNLVLEAQEITQKETA